ncbi:MAG: hypothetical protein K2O29_09850 [Ruminococcus sp.]|nr:hypothetical protein [Ruminococcus sp.]
MKKIISSLAASLMVASTISAVSVSAENTEKKNIFSVSTKILSESVVITNIVIPAGASAVTVSISGNNGLNSSSTKLIGGDAYNIIEVAENQPVLNKGAVLDDLSVVSTENNNCIAVVAASADYTDSDGDMFTFYIEKVNDSGDTSINIVDMPSLKVSDTVSTFSVNGFKYATCGDVNDDGYIDAVDASQVFSAVAKYTKANTSDPEAEHFTPFLANLFLSDYLPYAPCAETADTNMDGLIQDIDAEKIMKYYAAAAVGNEVNDKDNHCGEPIKYSV